MSKKRLLSGIRPTGTLHIGHYLGVLRNWASLQDSHDCFYSIVDWHTLTTKYKDTSELTQNTIEVAKDIISSGVDPKKSVLFVQSAIKEIAELHLLLSMVTFHNWVERDPTLKDMVKILAEDPEKAKEEVTYGLLGYPVLQSADILSVLGEVVPVGKDQVAHIELTRDIARRFNHIYESELFPEPKPLLTDTPSVPGVDGQKMSKSYNNDIKIVDSEEATTKQVRKMVTDPSRQKKTDPGKVENCEVAYKHYEIFTDDATLATVKEECESAKIGCSDCKVRLAGFMNEHFKEVREKRNSLKDNDILEILNSGNKVAQVKVRETLSQVREAMKIKTWE